MKATRSPRRPGNLDHLESPASPGFRSRAGFTLVEMLVVVAVIAILAAILIPTVGGARKTALRRKAELECNSIKTAVEQFFADFKYMPWGDPDDAKARVGDDQWTQTPDEHKNAMALLRGENKLRKAYLEISTRDAKGSSSSEEDEGIFYDPWKNPYHIGMDRNLDQQIDYTYGGSKKTYKTRVLVLSNGPDGEPDTEDDIRTFDLILD